MKKEIKLAHFTWAILWSLFLVFLSSFAGFVNFPESIWDLISTDKAAHLVVYGIYAFLCLKAFEISGSDTSLVRLGVVIWCSFYGFLMETFQYYFFPGRYFEFLDNIANISGILIGLTIFVFIKNKFSQSKE